MIMWMVVSNAIPPANGNGYCIQNQFFFHYFSSSYLNIYIVSAIEQVGNRMGKNEGFSFQLWSFF